MLNLLQKFWLGRLTEDIKHRKQAAHLPVDDECINCADFGEVIVVGDESSGKSWVLRRLLNLSIFQTGQDIITRHALRVQLRFKASATQPEMIFTVPGKEPLHSNDPKVIHEALKASHDAVQASGAGITDMEATLQVWSNAVPNIDIVDLPGLLMFPAPGEPVDLPLTVKTIVTKYVQKPNTVVLYIVDGKANQRNSPAAGLLNEVKPATIVKVFTKVDCLRDDRQTDGPLSAFLSKFYQETQTAVAVSNYEPCADAKLEDITKEESQFFKANVPNMDPNKFGIQALFQHVNRLAEVFARPKWANAQCELEKKQLAQLEMDLVNLGPILTSMELADFLVAGLFDNDPLLENLTEEAWNNCGFIVPDASSWTSDAQNVDAKKLLSQLETAMVRKIRACFSTHSSKLWRFEDFQTNAIENLRVKMEERSASFTQRWQDISLKIMLDHDASLQYSPLQWQRAAKCCVNRMIWAHLSDTPVGPTMPQMRAEFVAFLKNMSHAESEEAAETRKNLLFKIETLKGILQVLPAK